jgi:hypothetical protein
MPNGDTISLGNDILDGLVGIGKDLELLRKYRLRSSWL